MVMTDSSFLPFPLEQAEQAFGELGYLRSEAGRGKVETENYAGRGVPHFQARVLAQQEYHYAKQQRYRTV
jgi:hypothetical protein